MAQCCIRGTRNYRISRGGMTVLTHLSQVSYHLSDLKTSPELPDGPAPGPVWVETRAHLWKGTEGCCYLRATSEDSSWSLLVLGDVKRLLWKSLPIPLAYRTHQMSKVWEGMKKPIHLAGGGTNLTACRCQYGKKEGLAILNKAS